MTESEKNALQAQIAALPKGNITYKSISGKKYPYLQWTEDGRQHGRRIKESELDYLAASIQERKRLEGLLKSASLPKKKQTANRANVLIRTGDALRSFVQSVRAFKKRECFSVLQDYLDDSMTDKVFILCGLRRTGKTTLIRQAIGDMTDDQFSKAAFIQADPSCTLSQMNRTLQKLEADGYRYVFIDEVTLMEDFIEGAALFSDIYAASGMKLVLSGTDSLGFIFSEDESLYDRCILLHTTLIPYREFHRVLGFHDIDDYIRYGGTMSISGKRYHSASTFASAQTAGEYVDSAIAHNIQHSLRNYQYGDHFRALRELYDSGELTNAIQRIVEDINHAFTLDVLTREFHSHDLRVSANNLRRDRSAPSDILDQVNTEEITRKLRELLCILEKDESSVKLTEVHRAQIKEYLRLLDLVVDMPVVQIDNYNSKSERTIITQPGMRYAQTQELIGQLLADDAFRSYSLHERTAAAQRIMQEVMGRMMEDIVLLETQTARPHAKVFPLQFAVGEFDMVVFEPEYQFCEIYEIKHSTEIAPPQARHLRDEEKCKATAFRFGEIRRKGVIYRGQAATVDQIEYINVEEYLLSLGKQGQCAQLT